MKKWALADYERAYEAGCGCALIVLGVIAFVVVLNRPIHYVPPPTAHCDTCQCREVAE